MLTQSILNMHLYFMLGLLLMFCRWLPRVHCALEGYAMFIQHIAYSSHCRSTCFWCQMFALQLTLQGSRWLCWQNLLWRSARWPFMTCAKVHCIYRISYLDLSKHFTNYKSAFIDSHSGGSVYPLWCAYAHQERKLFPHVETPNTLTLQGSENGPLIFCALETQQ